MFLLLVYFVFDVECDNCIMWWVLFNDKVNVLGFSVFICKVVRLVLGVLYLYVLVDFCLFELIIFCFCDDVRLDNFVFILFFVVFVDLFVVDWEICVVIVLIVLLLLLL